MLSIKNKLAFSPRGLQHGRVLPSALVALTCWKPHHKHVSSPSPQGSEFFLQISSPFFVCVCVCACAVFKGFHLFCCYFQRVGGKITLQVSVGHCYHLVSGEHALGHGKPRQGKGREKLGQCGAMILELVFTHACENSYTKLNHTTTIMN